MPGLPRWAEYIYTRKLEAHTSLLRRWIDEWTLFSALESAKRIRKNTLACGALYLRIAHTFVQ
jgi:hypothetical protein